MIQRKQNKQKADVILCSDLHLREDKPTCWTGDFLAEQWEALDFISSLQRMNDCPVLCGGDLFHHWKPSPFLISETIRHLPHRFHTIYGQHDLPQHSLELAYKCGINTLLEAKSLILLPNCHWGQTPDEFCQFSFHTEHSILVWHVTTYKNDLPWPGCTASSAKRLLRKYPQYSLILTGDNHQPFVEEYEGRLLVNPGSMTRQNADQINHRPRVYLWYAETNTVEPVYLPIRPAIDCISREHIEVIERRNERIDAFVSNLDMDWEMSVSFKRNLQKFENKNKVQRPVMDIIYKAIEV